MTPELESYIIEKERLLTEEFRLKLNFYDYAELVKCTTESSVDKAARRITKRKLEANEYDISETRSRRRRDGYTS